MNREDLAVISSVFPLALLVALYVWWRIAGSDRQKAKQKSWRIQHEEFSSAFKTVRLKPSQASGPAFSEGTMRSHYSGDLALGGALMMNDVPARSRLGTSDPQSMESQRSPTMLPDNEQWDYFDSPALGADPSSLVGPLSLLDSDEHHDLHLHEDPFVHGPDHFGIDP